MHVSNDKTIYNFLMLTCTGLTIAKVGLSISKLDILDENLIKNLICTAGYNRPFRHAVRS